jgi:fucose permease
MGAAHEDGERAVRRARVAVSTTFAMHAVIAGSLGPWMPRLKLDNGLDPAGLGVALTGFAIGMVLGTRAASPLLRRSGGRRVVRVGIPALAAGFALLPAAVGLASLTAVFVAFGLASGLLDVAMNNEAVEVERRMGRRVMSAMHGMWSLAMFAGTGIASAGIAVGIPIGVQLPVLSALLVVASFPLLAWLPTTHEADASAGMADPGPTPPADAPSATGRVMLLCLIAGTAFLTEGIAADWSAVYLHESVGSDLRTAGLGVVAFSAGMASVRFASDRLSAHVPQARLVRAGAATAAVALGTALLVGGVVPTIVAFAIVGLSLGPVVPFVFRAAGGIALPGGRTALANTVTAGYLGAIAGPLIVGFVADQVGLRAAFFIPVFLCVLAALAAGATRDR